MSKKKKPTHSKAKKPLTSLIGREEELVGLRACLKSNRNILIEGPVGVGKTHLAIYVAEELGRKIFRIDGDNRYSEQKMAGWFDPPTVLKKGFTKDAFFAGPLVQAMEQGGVLFINELNRLPEGVQNVLLPAIDEKMIVVPRLGEIRAKPGFQVIATQNPKEFVATSHLSEAILDRFDLIYLDYQSMSDEIHIVNLKLDKKDFNENISRAAVKIARLTRVHPRVKRGASVRAAIGIAELTQSLMLQKIEFKEAFARAVHLALPTRIELERGGESGVPGDVDDTEQLLQDWINEAISDLNSDIDPVQKKKI